MTDNNAMTAAPLPLPSAVKLDTLDWPEFRLILHVMIDAQKAAPKSRERALVITKLEEARLWAGEVCEYCAPGGPCNADDCKTCCWCHRDLGPSEIDRLRSDLAATKAKLEELEGLFQRTHGCHWSWGHKVTEQATELDATKAKLAAAERENAAWRALAEQSDVDDISLLFGHIDETARTAQFRHGQSVVGGGATAQAAAIDLATKLGLIPAKLAGSDGGADAKEVEKRSP